MSEVTDIRCAVSRGDFAGGASLGELSVPLGTFGTSGAGESARGSCADDVDDSRLLRRERDREPDCESGRGVISEASSKLSCGTA